MNTFNKKINDVKRLIFYAPDDMSKKEKMYICQSDDVVSNSYLHFSLRH